MLGTSRPLRFWKTSLAVIILSLSLSSKVLRHYKFLILHSNQQLADVLRCKYINWLIAGALLGLPV